MFWNNSLTTKKILKPKTYNCGTLQEVEKELLLDGVEFKIHKNNVRPRPQNKNHVVILSCFSEFGSELVACLYCIPELLQNQYLGYYIVAMGWHGREYLYRHLVDEFWELDSKYQWLREYCRAYHHASKNLRTLEKKAKTLGRVVDANVFTQITLKKIYPRINTVKKEATWIPTPGIDAFVAVEKFLKPNSVGVTARYRKCYGRNLQLDFYKRLLDLLQDKGYNPIWMGEIGTTYECPYSHITNFRDTPEARDLEKTLALTANLEFTIQFWTASTRLAGSMGVPFILFESPDQIYNYLLPGHEGLRLELCTKGKKKLVISHFMDIHNDNQLGLDLVSQSISEINSGNWSEILCPGCEKDIFIDSKNSFQDSLIKGVV